MCHQLPVKPVFDTSIDEILNDPEFKKSVENKLSGAIKIPTEVFDDTPPPEVSIDPWLNYSKFHEYLKEIFQLVHSHLKLEKVNKVGLLYTFNLKCYYPLVTMKKLRLEVPFI